MKTGLLRFALVELIYPGCADVHDLGTAVTVLFQSYTLSAVVSVGNSIGTADQAAFSISPKAAFVAYMHYHGRPHERVADWTLSIALFA